MKKAALTTLQVGITVGILYFILRDPTKRAEMVRALRYADQGWLIAGLMIYGAIEVAAGVRWQLLLRVQGIQLSWFRVFMLLMIGIFFNFFIPGGTGGDVVKIFYLLKETPGQRTQALLSVLVDRVIGVFSLILVAGFFIGTQWDWLTSTPDTARAVYAALIILVGSFLAIGFSFLLTSFGLVHKLPPRFPGRDKLAELAFAYNLYGLAWKSSLAAFFISIVAHLGYFATFHFAAQSLHASGEHLPTFAELCAVMPVVNTIASMPISIGGIGVREGLFQILLGQLTGVTEAMAVVISSTGYLLTLAWGMIGGVLYLFYRPSKHARLREMQAKVAAIEHAVAEQERAHEVAEEQKR